MRPEFTAGKRVRPVHDPGRQGTLSGATRSSDRGVKYQVNFPEGRQWCPEDQLELVPEEPETPLDHFEECRLAGPEDLRRTLTHLRLSGRLAEVIYSINTTATDFYAYQFKPVIKLLNSPSRGLLVADEVGLGKTVEAGLIWTELRARVDSRRLLVLCPAMLRDKWVLELSQKFGLRPEILGAAETLDRLRDAEGARSTAEFSIVASIQGLRPPRGWQGSPDSPDPRTRLASFLQSRDQESPLLDLVVIDEAHYLRNPETKTAELGRLLRPLADHFVLLSATPVHLKSEDLFHLLQLVDPDQFERREDFQHILGANDPLNRARDLLSARKVDLSELLGALTRARAHPLLRSSRRLAALVRELLTGPDLSSPRSVAGFSRRIERLNLLGDVLTRTRKRDVKEWRVTRRPWSEPVEMTPHERRFFDAVTEIVREYCQRAGSHEGFLLVTPQRQASSSMPAALRLWQRRAAEEEGVFLEEVFEDFGILPGEEVEFRPVVHELARRAHDLGPLHVLIASDSKYRRLVTLLKSFRVEHPAEKVILFSYFRATLDYLQERLAGDGIPSLLLMGGAPDKSRTLEKFKQIDGPKLLLSSEVGSEGIDLQFSSTVINYDLPWNPMRVEQRIGRVDRLGQKSDVVNVWNLFYANTIDSRIHDRLYKRLGIFERALGGLEPILGEKVRDLTVDLLSKRLSPDEEEDRIDQTARAIENIRSEEEQLEQEAANLVAHGDYILREVKAAEQLNRQISASDLYFYVRDFLNTYYRGSELLVLGEDEKGWDVDVRLSNQAGHALEEFVRQKALAGATRLHSLKTTSLVCRFENSALPADRGGTEIISPFHPLVRFVGHELRTASEKIRPAVAIRLRSESGSGLPPGRYAFAVHRWWFRGLQDVEHVHYSVRELARPAEGLEPDAAERLVLASARSGEPWLAAIDAICRDEVTAVITQCVDDGDVAFEIQKEDARQHNEDRGDLQEQNLDRHYRRHKRMLEEQLARYRMEGNTRLIPATEGRLNALERRTERQRLKIQSRRRDFAAGCEEDVVGVIELLSS